MKPNFHKDYPINGQNRTFAYRKPFAYPLKKTKKDVQ